MTDISLTIKPQAGGEEFTVTVPLESTVGQLKDTIIGSGKVSIERDAMRLLYKGRILKDEQSVTEAKLENGVTVVLVASSESKKTGE